MQQSSEMYCVDEVYNDISFSQYKNFNYNTWKIFLKNINE
jgi:hypothetical protein